MLTSQLPLRQLLNDPTRQYYCPPIQREYVWGKELLEELWNDLENIRQDGGNSHFMGTVIVSAGEDVNDENGRFSYQSCMLIDGQQRLTSFFLLLWAAYERLSASGVPSHVRMVSKLRSCLTLEAPAVLKLRPTLVDLETFEDILAGNTKRSRRRIAQAWAFFKTKVAEFDTDLERLVDIVEVALNKALFAVVSLTDDEDPCTFFAAANGKSQPLSATELIKNLLLMKSGEKDLLQAEARFWGPFAGDIKDPATVSMLMLTAHDVRCGWDDRAKVHRNLGARIREVGAAEFFADLQAWKAAYNWIRQARFEGEPLHLKLKSGARRTRQLTAYFAPKAHFIWMLPVRKFQEGSITEVQLRECLEWVENYAVRLFGDYGTVLSYWTRETNAPRLIGLDGDAFADAFRKVLVSHSDYRQSRGDAPLKEFMQRVKVSKGASQSWAAAVLLGIEMRNHGDVLPHEPTVEHVLPQKWYREPEWAGAFNRPEDESLPLALGNLTIASSDPNTQMGNGPWSTKRAKLQNSSFRMNRDLAGRDSWTREVIEERTRELAEQACQVWPLLS